MRAALLDDAVNRRQAQARALAEWLSREERLERTRQRLLVHAQTVVAHRQRHIFTKSDVRRTVHAHDSAGRRKCDRAALRQRIGRIDDQIDDDLVELPGIDAHWGYARIQIQHDDDVLLDETA